MRSLAEPHVHLGAVRTQNRLEALVLQEICDVKSELEAFDLTMADSDTESVEVPPPQNHGRVLRKLVLVSGTQQVEVPAKESESEAEGCPSEQESLEDDQSEKAAEEEDGECREPVQDIVFVPQRRSMAAGFESLDMVDLERVFEVRALVMKSVPGFMKGAFRGALKISLEEIIRKGQLASNVETTTRGWKLFMLLPRMLLCRPPRGGLIPRKRLEERLAAFNDGDWVTLIEFSLECADDKAPSHNLREMESSRRRQNDLKTSNCLLSVVYEISCRWAPCHQHDKFWRPPQWQQEMKLHEQR